MNATNDNIWDAKRLVKEYILLADSLDSVKGNYEMLDWPDQIKAQRLASAISACLGVELDTGNPLLIIGKVFNCYCSRTFCEGSWAESKPCPITKEKFDEAIAMIKEVVGEKFSEDRYGISDYGYQRMAILEWLFKYRKLTYGLTQCTAGLLAGNSAIYNAIHVAEELYLKPIQEGSEKVDTIIATLLGTPFEQSFKEEELIEKHHFPTTTDKELTDWWIDNL